MTDVTPSGRDPFEELATPIERQEPRPSFARSLRARLLSELGLDDEPPPTVPLPERKPTVSATTTVSTTPATTHAVITPYLTSADAAAAIDWYHDAFGAEEAFRVVDDNGVVGHAELTIAGARFMLSDEHPALGVRSPRSLGGPSTAFHLDVDDADALFARAVAAGATVLQEPADQPHGARHGTLLDPDGHRWMLSQQLEPLDLDDYAERSSGSGYEVVVPDVSGVSDSETVAAADRPGTGGGIWAAVFYRDAPAGIRFLVDTFGFEEQLVVTGDDGSIVHSELRWPEGGVVQVGTADTHNPFNIDPGAQSLYVITADPERVWEASRAAGLEVVRAPESPDYDPEGTGFAVRDPEGNIWTFGTYGLAPT